MLSAIPPKPQLQYELNNALTLYVGAELIGGTYHLNNQFGTNHASVQGTNHSSLNGQIVDFNEDRVGAGVTWKFTPNLSLDLSGGYIPYRTFDYHPLDHDRASTSTRTTSFHNNDWNVALRRSGHQRIVLAGIGVSCPLERSVERRSELRFLRYEAQPRAATFERRTDNSRP